MLCKQNWKYLCVVSLACKMKRGPEWICTAPSLLLYYLETRTMSHTRLPSAASITARDPPKIRLVWVPVLACSKFRGLQLDSVCFSVPSTGQCCHCWSPATCTHPVYTLRLRLRSILVARDSLCTPRGVQTERMYSWARYQHTQEERHARYACTGSQPQTLTLNLHFSQGVYVCTYTIALVLFCPVVPTLSSWSQAELNNNSQSHDVHADQAHASHVTRKQILMAFSRGQLPVVWKGGGAMLLKHILRAVFKSLEVVPHLSW